MSLAICHNKKINEKKLIQNYWIKIKVLKCLYSF